MKIYNFNGKKIIKSLIVILIILLLVTIFISFQNNQTIKMTSENYTDILKSVHDNPQKYKDKQITTSGYVYRADDFANEYFVCARDMLVSQNESRIVGFLCEYENAKDYQNNEWISINGIIDITDYHGAMPIIKVKKITKITTPNDFFVNPPQSIPMSS